VKKEEQNDGSKQIRVKGFRRWGRLHDRRHSLSSRASVQSWCLHKSFKPAEIVSEDTGLGRMVSVSLIRSIDTGGERFGFFLPFINVDRGQTAHFHTVGVYETYSGPDSIPHRPSTWRCIEMSGTAESVIVPL
jgi:hypothetical protein